MNSWLLRQGRSTAASTRERLPFNSDFSMGKTLKG